MKYLNLKRFDSFYFLFALFIIIFYGCEKEEVYENSSTDSKNESLSNVSIKGGSYASLSKNKDFLDLTKKYRSIKEARKNYNKKGDDSNDFYNFIIDSSYIITTKAHNKTSFTFRIKRDTISSDSFENLVLQKDSIGNLKAYIIKYHLKDDFTYIENHDAYAYDTNFEIFQIDEPSKIGYSAKYTTCPVIVYETWCSWDYPHLAGPGCVDDGRLYTKGTFVDGDCGSGGFWDGGSSGGTGGGGSSGPEDGVVTTPNEDPFIWDLKNFASGTLTPDERTYYNSNSNIKNNINTYLIDNDFSFMSEFYAKATLGTGGLLSLDYKVFNWGFDNDNNILTTAQSFLVRNGTTSEAIAFAKNIVEFTKMNPGIKIDMNLSYHSPYNIDLSAVKPDNNPNTDEPDKEAFMYVYNALTNTNGFKDLFTDIFEGDDKKYSVKFEIVDDLECNNKQDVNGCTVAIYNNVNDVPQGIKGNHITIYLDKNYLQTASFINIAKTICHEAIHANLKLLQIDDKNMSLPGEFNLSYEEFAYDLKIRFGGDDHLFMANYYRPVMEDTMEEVMPLLYTQERIDNEIGTTPVYFSNEFLETWNWAHFYEYFVWHGLHETSIFFNQIESNTSKYKLYVGYREGSDDFGHQIPD